MTKTKALYILDISNLELEDSLSLKRKYIALIKKYHPDINNDNNKLCCDINEAYNFLLKLLNVKNINKFIIKDINDYSDNVSDFISIESIKFKKV